MNTKLMLMAAALAAGLLAGCEPANQQAPQSKAEVPSTMSKPAPQVSSTAPESKDAGAPIQGQTDSKEPAQRRDFETK